SARGNIRDAAHVIHRHTGPAVCGVIFRVIPRVVTELAGVRHSVKGPQMFSCLDVKTPRVLFKSGHHDDFLKYGGTGCRCAKTSLHPTWEECVPVLTKRSKHPTTGRFQRIKNFDLAEHHPLL